MSDRGPVDGAFQALADALVARGFVADGRAFSGDVDISPERVERVSIEQSPGYPFTPPHVTPKENPGASWHVDPLGRLCLYSPEDSSGMPWRDVDALLEHIAGWFRDEEAGWPRDAPLLDLDRYFRPSTRREFLLIGGDLRDGDRVVFEESDTHRAVPLQRRTRDPRGRQAGAVGRFVDVGNLERPFMTWDQLRALLPVATGQTHEREIRDRKISFLVVRYTRFGRVGHVALDLATTSRDGKFAAMACSTIDDATLRLRGGPQQPAVTGKRVAVVGVGAIGSFVADLLVRAGVRDLWLYDHDVLRPGNSVRHLAGRAEWGRPKVEATACVLRQHQPRPNVRTVDDLVASFEGSRTVFEGVDLVIDATGNSWTTGLLTHESQQRGTPMLVVYCQRVGEIVRIDRVPLSAGEAWKPAVPPGLDEPPAVYDSGCGDPVSPTPASAVVAAAAATVSLAVDVLQYVRVPPTTLLQLSPQADLGPLTP